MTGPSAGERAPSLRIERLSFQYPDGCEALCDLSLEVAPGEAVGLIGPNGAGKTTLLSLAAGLLRPATGALLLDDAIVSSLRPGKVGLLFQNPDDQLFMPSVAEDVAFGPRNLGLGEDEVAARVAASLAAVGLGGFGPRHPHRLSGGEKRRAALAAVLALRPGALLLDEPSADLDHRARRRLIELLVGRPETRLVATHDLELVLDLCSRAVILDAGRIVADGPSIAILKNAALLEKHGLEPPWSLRSVHRHAALAPDDPHHLEHHRHGVPHLHP